MNDVDITRMKFENHTHSFIPVNVDLNSALNIHVPVHHSVYDTVLPSSLPGAGLNYLIVWVNMNTSTVTCLFILYFISYSCMYCVKLVD